MTYKVIDFTRSNKSIMANKLLSSNLEQCLRPIKSLLNTRLFKLTGQNALDLKFKTRFSQIGLSLGENL